MKSWKHAVLTLLLAGPLAALSMRAQDKVPDAQVLAEVQKSLDARRFSDIHSAVKNGVVTLTGTADVYATKEDAEHRIHHKKGVTAVQNLIKVPAGDVSDVALRDKLAGEAGL